MIDMEPMLLRGGTLVDLDPLRVERADLRLEAGKIVDRRPGLSPHLGETLVELRGRLVLPGLVIGHTHLYSTLARGMPAPAEPPRDFPEILEKVWWRLDRALDPETIRLSALVGAIEAVRAGATTIVDHHASPSAIEGSLDIIAEACQDVGVRCVLCYETTDRNGPGGRARGLAENRRFLARGANPWRAGLVGAHASFTLDDATLEALAGLAAESGAGVHIHLAEDPCDDADARRRGAASALERLDRAGLVNERAVLAHGTHLGPEAHALVRERRAWLVHNPRSNMNNAVGYARIALVGPRAALGTDGISGDVLAEARAAFLKARDARAGVGFDRILSLVNGSAALAGEQLGVTLGRLAPGAAADIVILDYSAPTPVDSDSIAGHLLFGIEARHVASVIVGGKIIVERRGIPRLDLEKIYAEARAAALRLWRAMSDER